MKKWQKFIFNKFKVNIYQLNCFLQFLKLNSSSDWIKILKYIFQEIWSLLIKIISTVHKLLFSKTSELYTLGTKIWKNTLSSYESKKNLWICMQLKYDQLRITSEISISLQIIQMSLMFNSITFHSNPYFGYSATFVYFSEHLYEFAMLPDAEVYLGLLQYPRWSALW